MFKNILNKRIPTKFLIQSSSGFKIELNLINNHHIFQFSTKPKRMIELEKNTKINQILKHKKFVIFIL